MNEIEKMYDNCNLLKPHAWSCKLDRIREWKICEYRPCKNCKYSKQEYYHKPFTVEKQLELIKFLMEDYSWYLDVIDTDNFENSLAASLNDLWHSLTKEEKQQVKGILK